MYDKETSVSYNRSKTKKKEKKIKEEAKAQGFSFLLFNLIVVSEMVIGNGDCSRTHDNIHKTISTLRERVVVNPDMT